MNHRLPTGGSVNRNRPLQFRFNGKSYTGLEGDTLASALLANGVTLVARSWKYHRPRGILSAGVEEPNAIVQLFEGDLTVPNARMTEIALVEGLSAHSVNANPSVSFDWRAIHSRLARLMPAGFYYKTFMASQSAWHRFEKHIRAASGLGYAPAGSDPNPYDKRYGHCDVLVVGGGLAGLSAALAASRGGARVVLCDEQLQFGGWLLSSHDTVDDLPAPEWVSTAIDELRRNPNVTLLPNSTAYGFHDHNLVTVVQRRTDHLQTVQHKVYRERLWKVRAKHVLLATGAHERPMVFSNNDLPGVMLANAVTTYVRRYAVRLCQKAVIYTNNSLAYEAAIALHDAGVNVTIVDARQHPDGVLVESAQRQGIAVLPSHVVVEAKGGKRVRSVVVQAIDAHGQLIGAPSSFGCEVLAMSGGFSPVVHLYAQAGGKLRWDDAKAALVPAKVAQAVQCVGAAAGLTTMRESALSGHEAGVAVARDPGLELNHSQPPRVDSCSTGDVRQIWLTPHQRPASRVLNQFVDFQNDVTAADIHLALREGFESIEHVKRYTGLGFGTDQGKTANINAMGIVSRVLKLPIDEIGTTTFRPNYTPVSFGAIAGLELGDTYEPIRTTAIHAWHVAHNAQFEDVGQWKRPWYYPRDGENMQSAVHREVLAVRERVGMLDASTLGKIEIHGPDASQLLNLVYTNAWSKLEVGKCRYGLMLDENGMVFDDGVTVRLGENHYLMHTTSGGAARVYAWLERWLQTEWPHFKVFLTSVTEQWATVTVAGPHSRDVLRRVCHDVSFEDADFPFMSCKEGSINDIPARIMRISYSGERSYEVNVARRHGESIWNLIYEAGSDFGITPYGTEAMHVLRAEKGFIIVGQDTDGSVTPVDLGMRGLVSQTKDFIGKRSLARSAISLDNRKQFVGLLTEDPNVVMPEGAHIVNDASQGRLSLGHVTSSYMSPTLKRSIALALVQNGLGQLGQRVNVFTRDGQIIVAQICAPTFFDPQGSRQNA